MDNVTTVLDTTRPITFEDSLLTYEQARLNGSDMEFRNVTLKVAVGNHQPGEKFSGAFISTAGVFGLRQDDKASIETYHLSVSVGPQIDVAALLKSPCDCGDPNCASN